MTKTIAVLLSLCIMLGSCGRDQKILDLEKREKEEASKSAEQHLQELEGSLSKCQTKECIVETRETAPCNCGENKECSCQNTDTSKEKAGRWGKWDNPYFSIDTWMHPSKWDIREYLTIGGITVAVIVVGGITYYVYKNRMYKREMEIEFNYKIYKEKMERENDKAKAKWERENTKKIHDETIDKLIEIGGKADAKLATANIEIEDKDRIIGNKTLVINALNNQLADTKGQLTQKEAELATANRERDDYKKEAETANKDKEEAYIAKDAAVYAFEKRDATLAVAWKEKDAAVYALTQKEAELQLLKEKYGAK